MILCFRNGQGQAQLQDDRGFGIRKAHRGADIPLFDAEIKRSAIREGAGRIKAG